MIMLSLQYESSGTSGIKFTVTHSYTRVVQALSEFKVSCLRIQLNVPDQGRRRMVSALDLELRALTMRPLCLE